MIFDELFCEDAQAVTEEIRFYKNEMHSLLNESIHVLLDLLSTTDLEDNSGS